jgi:hypothetical protein
MSTCKKQIKKKVRVFKLFYSRFCFGPQICVGSSSFKSCGVVPWHGSLRNILLCTVPHHTSITLCWKPFSSRFWQYIHSIFSAALTHTETDQWGLESLEAPASSLSLSQTNSDTQFGDRSLTWCIHHRLLTEEAIFIPTYHFAVKTCGPIVKRHIFQLYMGRVSTYQSLYFCISDFSWKYNLE